MTASELSSKPPVTPTDLVARARADLVAGDALGAQTAALVAIAAALVERVAPKPPEGPPEAAPITFSDTCCGKCSFGTCYVDQMTGA